MTMQDIEALHERCRSAQSSNTYRPHDEILELLVGITAWLAVEPPYEPDPPEVLEKTKGAGGDLLRRLDDRDDPTATPAGRIANLCDELRAYQKRGDSNTEPLNFLIELAIATRDITWQLAQEVSHRDGRSSNAHGKLAGVVAELGDEVTKLKAVNMGFIPMPPSTTGQPADRIASLIDEIEKHQYHGTVGITGVLGFLVSLAYATRDEFRAIVRVPSSPGSTPPLPDWSKDSGRSAILRAADANVRRRHEMNRRNFAPKLETEDDNTTLVIWGTETPDQRARAATIAKRSAVLFRGSEHAPAYLEQAAADAWKPHDWVIHAVLQAISEGRSEVMTPAHDRLERMGERLERLMADAIPPRAATESYAATGKYILVVDVTEVHGAPLCEHPDDVLTGRVLDASTRATMIVPQALPGARVMFLRRHAVRIDVAQGNRPRRDVLSVHADHVIGAKE